MKRSSSTTWNWRPRIQTGVPFSTLAQFVKSEQQSPNSIAPIFKCEIPKCWVARRSPEYRTVRCFWFQKENRRHSSPAVFADIVHKIVHPRSSQWPIRHVFALLTGGNWFQPCQKQKKIVLSSTCFMFFEFSWSFSVCHVSWFWQVHKIIFPFVFASCI